METTANKNTATLMQLSALSQYCFPFGNFIFPTIIWSIRKNDSSFVNYNGKQILNFQLSLLLYSLILMMIAVPIFIYSVLNNLEFTMGNEYNWAVEQFTTGKITGMVVIALVTVILLFILKAAEFFLIIYASVKNSNGQDYNFPLTIKFIK